MKLLIIFFALINISKVNACNVELFSKIYRLENTQTLSSRDIIYKTDCGNEVSMKLTQILSSASGILTASFLEKEFLNQSVSIMPRKISLLNFNSTLKDQLNANSNLYFLNISSMNQLQSLGLIEGESLKRFVKAVEI